MLGHWFVVQYFASSEELPEYRCMRADFSLSTASAEDAAEDGARAKGPRVTMNFTYAFSDDPVGERLRGNITWQVPDLSRPAHWRHQEESCKSYTVPVLKCYSAPAKTLDTVYLSTH